MTIRWGQDIILFLEPMVRPYYVPVVTVVECAFTFPNGWIAGEFCYLVWMIYCTQRPNRYNWKPSLLQQVSRTCQHHNCNIYRLTTRIIFKGDWFQASRVGKNCKQAPQGWPNTGSAGSPACHVPHLLSMISYRHKRLKMSVSLKQWWLYVGPASKTVALTLSHHWFNVLCFAGGSDNRDHDILTNHWCPLYGGAKPQNHKTVNFCFLSQQLLPFDLAERYSHTKIDNLLSFFLIVIPVKWSCCYNSCCPIFLKVNLFKTIVCL